MNAVQVEKTVWSVLRSTGVSALLLLPGYARLVLRAGDVRLHAPTGVSSVAIAWLLEIAIVAAVFAASSEALRRSRWWREARMTLAVIVLPILVWRNGDLLPAPQLPASALSTAPWLAVLMPAPGWRVSLGILIAAAMLLILLERFRPEAYAQATRMGGVVAAGFGLFALLMCSRLVSLAAWRPPPNEIHGAPAAQAPNAKRPLLVWILFDELSYDQTFEHRAADLFLPSFDALRAESTLYSKVIPAGNRTAQVIPGLFSGKEVTNTEYTAASQLRVQTLDDSRWRNFDPEQTIFQDAREHGWRTAVAGWYNPYCPVLRYLVESCYWTNDESFVFPVSASQSVWRNLTSTLALPIEYGLGRAATQRSAAVFAAQEHLLTYRTLLDRTLAVMKAGTADFLFIHLPVPHPPAIYDRRRSQFTTAGGSYLDNLALADRTLGALTDVLKSSPRWPATTVIVNGDHSWRVNIWKGLPGWTEEERKASHGIFDQRPLLLIHRPAQTAPSTFAGWFPLMQLHSILREILLQG